MTTTKRAAVAVAVAVVEACEAPTHSLCSSFSTSSALGRSCW